MLLGQNPGGYYEKGVFFFVKSVYLFKINGYTATYVAA